MSDVAFQLRRELSPEETARILQRLQVLVTDAVERVGGGARSAQRLYVVRAAGHMEAVLRALEAEEGVENAYVIPDRKPL